MSSSTLPGKDNCVHVWDIAKACTVRTVFGPHICGDAVDVMGTTILTGSWRDESQVHLGKSRRCR